MIATLTGVQVIEIPDTAPRGTQVASPPPMPELTAVQYFPAPLAESAEVLAVTDLDLGNGGASGWLPFSTRTVTSDTTANPGELLEVDASGGEVIITPPPTPAPGTYLTVLKIDQSPNAVHWASPVNADIEGASIVSSQAAATFVFDGSTWLVESVNTSLNIGVPDAVNVEGAQDAAAYALTHGTHTGIGFAYDDTAGTISATVAATAWPSITGRPLPSNVGPRAGSYDTSLNLYSPSQAAWYKLRAAIATAALGTSTVNMLCVGDSKTAGTGAGTSRSWPTRLRTELAAAGITPVGTGIVAAFPWMADTTLDTRWATTGPWTAGSAWVQASAAGATLTFTADAAGTVVDVWYFNNSAAFTLTVDGAAPVTVTPTGAATVGHYAVSGLANTAHTVTVTSTGLLYFIAVHVHPTTGFFLHNAGVPGIPSGGWGGAAATAFPGVGFAYAAMLPAPDILTLELGAADGPASVAPAQYSANLTAAYSFFGSPATLLIAETHTNFNSFATWQAYQSALYDLADSTGLPLVDLAHRWGTSANAFALGILGPDSVHESARGHADVARVVGSVLTAGLATPRTYVSPSAPSGATAPYLWVQTGLPGGNMTIWVEDGS